MHAAQLVAHNDAHRPPRTTGPCSDDPHWRDDFSPNKSYIGLNCSKLPDAACWSGAQYSTMEEHAQAVRKACPKKCGLCKSGVAVWSSWALTGPRRTRVACCLPLMLRSAPRVSAVAQTPRSKTLTLNAMHFVRRVEGREQRRCGELDPRQGAVEESHGTW